MDIDLTKCVIELWSGRNYVLVFFTHPFYFNYVEGYEGFKEYENAKVCFEINYN